MEHIKGLIFDLDGTLLESMKMWRNLGQLYLSQKGIDAIPHNLQGILAAMELHESVDWLKREFNLPESPKAIMQGIELMLRNEYLYHIEPKPGTIDFLEKLTQSAKYKLCLATATPRHLVEPALKRLKMDHYFSFILTVDEVGVGKHKPDIYLMAAEKLGLKKNQTLVFEDVLYAIQTAKDAGFQVVAVAEEVEEDNRQEILNLADFYVENIADTLEVLR